MIDQTIYIVLINIIDVMFNIFEIRILLMSELSTIFRCTPIQCKIERQMEKEHDLERKHTKNGLINQLFNVHYVHDHQLGLHLIIVFLQMLAMEVMKQTLVWISYYNKRVPWMQCFYIHSKKMSQGMMLMSLNHSSKALNWLPTPLSLDLVGQSLYS